MVNYFEEFRKFLKEYYKYTDREVDDVISVLVDETPLWDEVETLMVLISTFCSHIIFDKYKRISVGYTTCPGCKYNYLETRLHTRNYTIILRSYTIKWCVFDFDDVEKEFNEMVKYLVEGLEKDIEKVIDEITEEINRIGLELKRLKTEEVIREIGGGD